MSQHPPARRRFRPCALRCRGGVSSLLRLCAPARLPATLLGGAMPAGLPPFATAADDPQPGFITPLYPSRTIAARLTTTSSG